MLLPLVSLISSDNRDPQPVVNRETTRCSSLHAIWPYYPTACIEPASTWIWSDPSIAPGVLKLVQKQWSREKLGDQSEKNRKKSEIRTFIPFISFVNLRHVLRLLLMQRGTLCIFSPGMAHPATCHGIGARLQESWSAACCLPPVQSQHGNAPETEQEEWAMLRTLNCWKAVEINLDNALSNKLAASEDNELGLRVFQSVETIVSYEVMLCHMVSDQTIPFRL